MAEDEFDIEEFLRQREEQIKSRGKKKKAGHLGLRNKPPVEHVDLEQADTEAHGDAVRKGIEQGGKKGVPPGTTTTGEASRQATQSPEETITDSEESNPPPPSR